MAVSTPKRGAIGTSNFVYAPRDTIRQFNNLWASLDISRRILQLLPEPKVSSVYLLITCNVVN